MAARANAPCFYADDRDAAALTGFLRGNGADVVFCFGWSKLLPRDALDTPPLGAVGFHPAALPANRGRHPLIWALTLGLAETASTFFAMEEDADSGPILSQARVAIESTDYASDLYHKVIDCACRQLSELTRDLAEGRLAKQPQDSDKANNWRKRDTSDGHIDWRMPAAGIYNLVRGLSHPYVGAHCATAAGDVKVWRAEIGPIAARNIEPGKVIDIDGAAIMVKCGDGTIRLTDHEFTTMPREGSYL